MNVQDVVANLKSLPPAPRVMPLLLRALNDVNSSREDIVELLQLDAGLVAKILSVSNSALYGGKGDITDIDEAMARLGYREIYRIVTNIYAKAFVGRGMLSYQIDSSDRWFNSVATGIVMEMLTRRLNVGDPATTYTVGLLHDIGKSVIDEVYETRYHEVFSIIEKDGMTLQQAECRLFGFDHAQIGAALMQNWNFPDEIVEPIAFQFEPLKARTQLKVAAMLHLSRWICASIGGAPGTAAWAFEINAAVLEMLGCRESIIPELLIESKEALMRKEELLKL